MHSTGINGHSALWWNHHSVYHDGVTGSVLGPVHFFSQWVTDLYNGDFYSSDHIGLLTPPFLPFSDYKW